MIRPCRARRNAALPLAVALSAGALLSMLAGCVGPNFKRPDAPSVQRYTGEDLPAQTAETPGAGGAAQRFLMGNDVPINWWKRFDSPSLDRLVEEALRANPDVQAAQAALKQALENTAAQRGSYFPVVQGEFDSSRNHDAVGVLSPTLAAGTATFNLFTPQVTVSYTPDVFGGNRRQVEALAATAQAARFQLQATYLTLTANVVNAAIMEAGFRAQIAATERAVALEREALEVLRRELALGAIAEGDVYAQEALVAQTESNLPALEKQRRAARDQLAILTGKLPAEFQHANFELDDLTLPTDLPLSVPSRLVTRRPDVAVAEAQLHAATAEVGVAIANFLPQITLNGSLGSSATSMADLFKPGTGFWRIGSSLSQTLFSGGTLLHQKRAADAALAQARAQYRSAVLTAFANVADALYALEADARAMGAAARATDAADRSLGVVRRQLELGSVSYLALVTAEQSYQQAAVTLAQTRANRLTDTVALFQALGGSIDPARN